MILPNVWDASSAKSFVGSGFAALATTSSACADVLGYEDGEHTPPDEMFAAIARIAGAVEVPVTADIERGYRLPPDEIVAGLVAAGAAGCNLEDSSPGTDEMIDLREQASFLAEVRSTADDAHVPLVINARVDVFIRSQDASAGMDEAVERGRAYLDAGADSLYPIGLLEAESLATFTERTRGAVNALFRPGSPSFDDLAAVGVARITFGGGLHQLTYARVGALAGRLKEGQNPYPPDARKS